MQPPAATLSLLALGAVLLGGCHSEPLPGDDGSSSVAGKTDSQRCDTSAACSGWTGSASSSSLVGKPGDPEYNPPQNALDGDLTTSWSSGKPQAADEWYQLDFGQTLVVQSIELDLGADASASSYDDYPRGYFVRLSDTPNDETATVIASGRGKTPITHIDLKGTAGRYVFIRQTVKDPHSWSIHELRAAVTWPAP